MNWVDRSISLQAAYNIADRCETYPTKRLFGAMDRFMADRQLINEDSRAQRFEATQKIALELDRRGVPLRDPAIEQASIEEIRETLGFSKCGFFDLNPQPAERVI